MTADEHYRDMEYQRRRAELEMKNQVEKKPVPEDIFKLAINDPIIYCYITNWRNGTLTWEQMLIAIVLELSKWKKEFIEAGLKMTWESGFQIKRG